MNLTNAEKQSNTSDTLPLIYQNQNVIGPIRIRLISKRPKKLELRVCAAASLIGALTVAYIISLFFVFNTSCSIRSLVSNLLNGVISACIQAALFIWIYRATHYKAILCVAALTSMLKFVPLICSLVNSAHYTRVVELCTFRNGPRLLYYSLIYDLSNTIIWHVGLILALVYQTRLLLKEKEDDSFTLSDHVTFQLQNIRSAGKGVLMGLLVNMAGLVAITVLVILEPDGKLTIVLFHLTSYSGSILL
ncbi:hypothetical protein K493DRAFT_387364 [Basidiobolus meristosporus CBS 931.73]|uniref:Uncharacterized protein n=1 Tax=Basidiobolus meristosporus CBS 931.73 TaxID=1314790 RepID=A0A1Y1XFL6_9FUNG|nr:hypothetical protein K493DRAFT_387364 [Basidiobolus meristosporus CBS 931.73]|eukprot:ORX84513.1 hypothetical protein K493DRAFT_387364 [Basidiobolus meristosporus CBS 931.73]